MPRRTAEGILQTRPPGSFLVRQSESGNQNDYSLSIRSVRQGTLAINARVSLSL